MLFKATKCCKTQVNLSYFRSDFLSILFSIVRKFKSRIKFEPYLTTYPKLAPENLNTLQLILILLHLK